MVRRGRESVDERLLAVLPTALGTHPSATGLIR